MSLHYALEGTMKIEMTFVMFKMRTAYEGDPNKRGPKLAYVDAAFQDYEAAFDDANDEAKIDLTFNLFVACKDWLQQKKDKSTVKRVFFTDKVNRNLIERRDTIQSVALQCLGAIANMAPERLPETIFNKKKIDALAKGTERTESISLSKGYTNERESYLKSGKIRATSASELGDLIDHEKLHKLSLNEFLKKAQKRDVGLVKYIKKNDRLQYMCIPNEQGLFCRPNGTLVDCGVDVDPGLDNMYQGIQTRKVLIKLFAYAMDSYGNLISSEIPKKIDLSFEGFQRFNHSSLNAGREVISAGMALFCQGKLRWIDNNSGHYKPNRAALYNALGMLNNDNVDLSDTCVGVYKATPPKSMSVYAVDAFMRNDDEPLGIY